MHQTFGNGYKVEIKDSIEIVDEETTRKPTVKLSQPPPAGKAPVRKDDTPDSSASLIRLSPVLLLLAVLLST